MGEEPDLPVRQEYPSDDPDFLVRRVPLSDEELDKYYYGMANRVLWPVSHYMIQHLELNREFMKTYRAVNRKFAEAVLEESQDDDFVWFQDYHLMLAPRIVRARITPVRPRRRGTRRRPGRSRRLRRAPRSCRPPFR